MSLHRSSAVGPWSLKTNLVESFGITHIERAALGVHRHIEESRPHVGMGSRFYQALRVYGEDVRVGKIEAHTVVPVAIQLVLELTRSRIPLDDQANLGRLNPGAVVTGPGNAPGHIASRKTTRNRHSIPGTRRRPETVADHPFRHHCRLVARVKSSDIHRRAIWTGDHSARSVREEAHDLEGHASKGRPRVYGVEDPDIVSTHARGGQLRVS